MIRAFEHRPLVVASMGYALGLTWLTHPWFLLLTPLLTIEGHREGGKVRFVPAGTLSALLVGLAIGLFRAPVSAPLLTKSFPIQGEAVVRAVPRLERDSTRLELAFDGRTWRARLPGRPRIALGDRLLLSGIAHPLADGFDAYARQRGVVGRLEVTEWRKTADGPWLATTAEGVRRPFEAFVTHAVDPDAAPLVLAFCLNLDDALTDPTRDELRATGTYHLVSASGLHVSVVSWMLMSLLSQLPVPRWAQIVLLALPLALYCLATGLEAPVIRASLMALVGLSAYLVRRTPDALTSLALAALAYLVWRPQGVFEIGFQLSFVTVAAMVLFGGGNENEEELGQSIWILGAKAARLSVLAFVASAPLIAYHFQTLSLVAIPANLLIMLSASGVVVLGLGGFLVQMIVPVLGVGMLQVAGYLAASVEAVTQGAASLPFAQVSTPPVPAAFVVLLYLCCLMLWRERIVQP